MQQTISLQLKPILIKFYQSNDFQPSSSFTLTIQYDNIFYKSKNYQINHQFQSIFHNSSWILIPILYQNTHNFIYISIKNSIQHHIVQNHYQNNVIKINTINKPIQYASLLSLQELFKNPYNKKTNFTFPIMHQGIIKAQAQFKLLIKRPQSFDCRLFKQINMNQQKQIVKEPNISKPDKKQQDSQQTPIQPIVSDTRILIIPQLFIKKKQISSNQFRKDTIKKSKINPQVLPLSDTLDQENQINNKSQKQNNNQQFIHYSLSPQQCQSIDKQPYHYHLSPYKKANTISTYTYTTIDQNQQLQLQDNQH